MAFLLCLTGSQSPVHTFTLGQMPYEPFWHESVTHFNQCWLHRTKHRLHTYDCKWPDFTVLYLHKFPTVRSYLPGSKQITHTPSSLLKCDWYNLAQLVPFGNDKVFEFGRGRKLARDEGERTLGPRQQSAFYFPTL